jgi:hypothetical protein
MDRVSAILMYSEFLYLNITLFARILCTAFSLRFPPTYEHRRRHIMILRGRYLVSGDGNGHCYNIRLLFHFVSLFLSLLRFGRLSVFLLFLK